MVVYHVFSGGQDAVVILERSANRPRVKIANQRTGKSYWVHVSHIVEVEKAAA